MACGARETTERLRDRGVIAEEGKERKGDVLKGREKGKVISEGEEKQSLRGGEKQSLRGGEKRSLLILVALASYLYKLGNAKRKYEEM